MAEGSAPDPAQAGDLGEYIQALDRLRLWAGSPSYRTLAKAVGPKLRPPQHLSHTTISNLFQPRRRRLDLDLVTATVRALGLAEPMVAQWRAAYVRVQAQARIGGPPGVLRQLPADLPSFTGREDHLARLLASATPKATGTATTVVISAIEGMAGVGKTQLAVHAAHELVRSGHYTEVQLFVNLHGFDPEHPPADPAVVLDGLLRQLGVAAQHIPESLDERAAMFRDRIHGREALVLLDNADSVEQIRHLIPASPSCLVLVTSRRSLSGLDGASLQTLDVFSPAESVALLARIAGDDRVQAEPEAAAAIAEGCGFLPLAVALAAARLRSRPAWTLDDLSHRLQASGLDFFSAGNRALRPAFYSSFQRLPQSARHLFCVLGLHPGDDFGTAAAAVAGGLTSTETDSILERLQDEHLLRSIAKERYRFHDLIRDYAAELVHTELTPGQQRAASHRLRDWYLAGANEARHLLSPGRVHPLLDVPTPSSAPSKLSDADHAGRWR